MVQGYNCEFCDRGKEIRMILKEKEVKIPVTEKSKNIIDYLSNSVKVFLNKNEIPIRFVITKTDDEHYYCELGIITSEDNSIQNVERSIFDFVRRPVANTNQFNSVLIVPTGIGAEIGGHDGDAGPVARLLASACDTLITHPNVVNASDINELPDNGLYVEGSVISNLFMGTIGLQKTLSNRVLVVLEANRNEIFVNAAINAVNAARATYGFNCTQVVKINPCIKLNSIYTSSGRASGQVDGVKYLTDVLDDSKGDYDAVAISSVINVPKSFHRDYFTLEGEMVNPWGGVEALLTHAVSLMYGVPSAHSPMFESPETANWDPGIVDPRMAAEAISETFLQSILKGLQRSPRIISDKAAMNHHSVITAADISCLVIPDGCVGLPTLAALKQGINVIAVRENKNLMKNDLTHLPWSKGQLTIVENYWEAVGVLLALKAGITPESVRRPIHSVYTGSKTKTEISKYTSQ